MPVLSTTQMTLDDLEKYIAVTGDTKPVLYLVEKYLTDETEELRREIERLQQRLAMKKVS